MAAGMVVFQLVADKPGLLIPTIVLWASQVQILPLCLRTQVHILHP